MRLLYMDEAGTSAQEPSTLVVGFVVPADAGWSEADLTVREALRLVPEHYRDGFTCHATAIWNDKRYRHGWSADDRRAFLLTMMSIPRVLGLPVTLGHIRRDLAALSPGQMPLRIEQFHHLLAFNMCVEQADDYVRSNGGADELLMVIAEDVPDMKSWLQKAVAATRTTGGRVVSSEEQQPTQAESAAGMPPGAKFRAIKRVIDVVHFVGKRDAPLLQVADACAFGFRRYFANLSFGEECVRAIVGSNLNRADWSGGASQWTFINRRSAPEQVRSA